MKQYSDRFVPYCHDAVPAAVFPATSCKRQVGNRITAYLTAHKC